MPTERPQPAPKPSKTTWPALLAACVIGAIWACVATLMLDPGDIFQGVPEGAGWFILIGMGIGQAVLIAGVLALALFYLFVRARAPKKGVRHFWILLSSTLGGAAVAGAFILFAVGSAHRSDAVLMEVFDSYDARAQAREQRMSAELDDLLGPGGNILADGLTAGADFDDMRRRVEAARQALESSEADILALQAETRAQLADMELTDAQRQRAADLMRFGFLEENRARERVISTQVAVLHQMEGQVDLLQQARGHWRVVDGQIEFDRQADHEVFAGYALGISNLNADLQAEMAEVDQSFSRGGRDR